MKKILLISSILMGFFIANTAAQDGFKPQVKYGAGTILQTVYQQSHDDGDVFEPAMLKVGFLHTDIQVTEKLLASASWAFHSGKLSDAFFKYTFNPYFALQLGRFKGAGSRAGAQTVQYDTDFGEFTYLSENLSAAGGAPDFRHYGVDVSGRADFISYKFTLHNGGSERTHYYSGANDGPALGNNGLKFKSWDALVSFFPIDFLEVGGHVGSVNTPGMGNKTTYAYTGHLYYIVPDKYKIKIDAGKYKKNEFIGAPPSNMDYSEHDFTEVDKKGFSILGGFNINPRLEPVARFEYFDHGNVSEPGVTYEKLKMLTVGANYYLFPESKRKAKISAFYQHRGESGGPSIKNDWFGISYQVFFMQ